MELSGVLDNVAVHIKNIVASRYSVLVQEIKDCFNKLLQLSIREANLLEESLNMAIFSFKNNKYS